MLLDPAKFDEQAHGGPPSFGYIGSFSEAVEYIRELQAQGRWPAGRPIPTWQELYEWNKDDPLVGESSPNYRQGADPRDFIEHGANIWLVPPDERTMSLGGPAGPADSEYANEFAYGFPEEDRVFYPPDQRNPLAMEDLHAYTDASQERMDAETRRRVWKEAAESARRTGTYIAPEAMSLGEFLGQVKYASDMSRDELLELLMQNDNIRSQIERFRDEEARYMESLASGEVQSDEFDLEATYEALGGLNKSMSVPEGFHLRFR